MRPSRAAFILILFTAVTLFFAAAVSAAPPPGSPAAARNAAPANAALTSAVRDAKSAAADAKAAQQKADKSAADAAKYAKSSEPSLANFLYYNGVILLILAGTLLTGIIVITLVFRLLRAPLSGAARIDPDKEIEAARVSYGFWLIVAGFMLTLAVIIVSIVYVNNSTVDITKVIAIVTVVTGAIGTLTTAFFGIQAAGAGRSQAMTALSDQNKSLAATQNPDTTYKIDPAVGPHAGNTRVSITGNGLTGSSAVNFGATAGTNFEFVNDGLIRVTTPPLELDRTATTQKGKSNVDVSVVFPTASAANRAVGTFYYYTVDVKRDDAGKKIVALLIFGTGLSGASAVQFGTFDAVPVKQESDDEITIDIPSDEVERATIWDPLWATEVEVAIIYAADSSKKRSVIGRFRIPPFDKPDTPASPPSSPP